MVIIGHARCIINVPRQCTLCAVLLGERGPARHRAGRWFVAVAVCRPPELDAIPMCRIGKTGPGTS